MSGAGEKKDGKGWIPRGRAGQQLLKAMHAGGGEREFWWTLARACFGKVSMASVPECTNRNISPQKLASPAALIHC